MPRRSEHPMARVSERLLAATIIAAPLAAGGFRLQVLPVLAALALAAFATMVYALRKSGRPLHATVFVVSLVVLAGFTALQAIPLPAGLLETLSPHAAEVRAFVAPGGSLSYEPGATWREAAKLILYAIVAMVAFERARVNKSVAVVAYPLMIAAVTTAFIAIVHRALGIERIFGLIEARGGSTQKMLTTFVNPNHAAGFMALCALTAVGLALDSDERPRRVGFLALAGVFGGVSVLVLSRGGLVALAFGLLLFGAIAFVRSRRERGKGRLSASLLVTALVIPTLGVVWRMRDVLADFGFGRDRATLGFDEKLAAVRDAVPMVEDHLWLGIGRGAYASVYTGYKTSPLQLTFAFPENLVAQLLGEWGVVVGVAALVGLAVLVVVRLRLAPTWTALGATCGVAAIVVQNAVDFSLEMPGVAIPVVAILAATGARAVKTKRIDLRRRWGAFAAIATVVLAAPIALAVVNGDLFDDLDNISRHDAETLLARHPASALVTARLAYRAETAEPPRLQEAIRLASRTMYLAPMYADGHVLTGRLLIRANHRRQGFGELRRAWALSPSARGPLIDYVIALAKSGGEVVRAIPRRDPALDVLDELEAARAITRLVQAKRDDWAAQVIEALGPVAQLEPESLTVVALAATKTSSTSYALGALERRLDLSPDDEPARIAMTRLLLEARRIREARQILDGIDVRADNAKAVLPLAVQLAVADEAFDDARAAVDDLERLAPPTRADASRLALLRAQVEQAAGSPARALSALDAALARDTSHIGLRLRRAQLLRQLGRLDAARVDAQFVLRRAPEHAGAQRLLEALGGAKP
ncbi:MAG: O-antigen ligase family protein [Deltaproteobacteria bacterium]